MTADSSPSRGAHIPVEHRHGARAGFADEEVLDNIIEFEPFFKRFIPMLIMMFLLTWLIASSALDGRVPASGLVGAFVAGGFCAIMTQQKKRQLTKLWGTSTLTLSPAGIDMQDGNSRLQMPWSQVEGIVESSIADPLRAGQFHWAGVAIAAVSAATSRRKEMGLLGVARISVNPGASILVKRQLEQNFGPDLDRVQTGVVLSYFERDWENGRIGQWIRAYRPDLLSDATEEPPVEDPPVNGQGEDAPAAANTSHAAERHAPSGEARPRGGWWRRYTDSLT